ncbi:hypothetical protein Ac2012v2_001154 [Leucoagaricus gongylophorus]
MHYLHFFYKICSSHALVYFLLFTLPPRRSLVFKMFKLSIFAVLAVPFVSALTVNQPSQAVNNGGDMTFTWTTASGDPSTFSVYLENPTFNSVYGVANNVDASKGTLTIEVPAVPNNQQYSIILVPIDNVNKVLAQSPSFTIGAAITTSTSTPSTSSVTPISSTGTRSLTAPGTTPTLVGTVTSSSSGFGSTIRNTNTNVATGVATGVASSGVTSSSAPSGTDSNSTSAALPVRFDMNLGVVASMVLSVFAGTAFVAL